MSSSKKTGNRFSQEEAVEILAQSILLREAIDNLIKEAVECLTKVEDKKPKLELVKSPKETGEKQENAE